MSNTDYFYGLLMEGRMDMMYLPSGAVAWLWQYNRPENQIQSASSFAAIAYNLNDPIVDAALLRADHNVMVMHLQSGNKVSVYPDGGLGSNGEPLTADVESITAFINSGGNPEVGVTVALPADLEIAEPLI